MLATISQGSAADLGGREQGGYKDEPVLSEGYVWTGLYIGANVGYAAGKSSSVDGGTTLGPGRDPPYGAFSCGGPAIHYCSTPFAIEPEGWLAGGQIGYNKQFGSIVIGVEGEFGWLNASEEEILDRPLGDQDILSVDYSWYARWRCGRAWRSTGR